MILLIDNYDSFTYNLVQLIGQIDADLRVVRNDKLTVADVGNMKPSRIVISPGPGRPEQAGICVELIQKVGPRIPILGVCLGHQAIGYAFGATIEHASTLRHGKVSQIIHSGDPLFHDIPTPFEAGRYHSLVVAGRDLPEELEVIARTTDNVIMGIRHKLFSIHGIQFHPESILTPRGRQIIANWLHPIKVTA